MSDQHCSHSVNYSPQNRNLRPVWRSAFHRVPVGSVSDLWRSLSEAKAGSLPDLRVESGGRRKKNGARRRMWGEDGNGMRLIGLNGR